MNPFDLTQRMKKEKEKRLRENTKKFMEDVNKLQKKHKVVIVPQLQIDSSGVIPTFAFRELEETKKEDNVERPVKSESGSSKA